MSLSSGKEGHEVKNKRLQLPKTIGLEANLLDLVARITRASV